MASQKVDVPATNAIVVATENKSIASPEMRPSTLSLFSPEQKTLIKNTCMIVAVKNPDERAAITDDELELFCTVCNKTGLDPMLRQIYGMKRYDAAFDQYRLTIQLGIDALRIIASRHPDYDGQSLVLWCGADGVWKDIWTSSEHPFAAKVSIYRRGVSHEFSAIAYWHECYQTTTFWQKRGISQLAKCATAAALRMAFPQDLSSLYIPEEMPPVNDEEPCSKPTNGNGSNGRNNAIDSEALAKRILYDQIYAFMKEKSVSADEVKTIAKSLLITKEASKMTSGELQSILDALKESQAYKDAHPEEYAESPAPISTPAPTPTPALDAHKEVPTINNQPNESQEIETSKKK